MTNIIEQHNTYLELIKDIEFTQYSDEIFVVKYNMNEKEIILHYEKILDNIEIKGLNVEGLNIVRNYYRDLKKILIKNIKISITLDEYINFLEYVANVYINKDYYNKCCICGIILQIDDNKITCCEKKECKKTFNCVVTDNIITKSFCDYDVFNFTFECFSSVLKHPKFNISMINNIPVMEGVENLNDVVKIIPENIKNNDKSELFDYIKTSTNDVFLIEKIDNITYGLLKNIFTNNYFSIYTISAEIENKIISKNTTEKYFRILNINHSGLTENIFNKKENILFHGSSIHSWYTILKNGLVNLSGTALMANGAAHGNGIYLSDSLNFSLGYSRSYDNYLTVIGVFLLNDDINKYKKCQSIYVVQDCSKLILKSLVIGKGLSTCTHSINTLIVEIEKIIKMNNIENKILEESVFKLKNKRLNKEYELLKTKDYIESVNIIDDTKWKLTLKKNNKHITIELIFNNYPIIAPSIITNEETKINKKIINGTPILDLEILNPNNWRVTTKLTDIIELIIKNY
jgi:hypothetical protein